MTTSTSPLVLVTGCSGLIGNRLARALASDHRVVGLDLEEPTDRPAGVHFIECDLTSQESVRRALDRVRAEHGTRVASVVHLAAYYDFSGEPSPLYEELTVEGTRRLVRELKRLEVAQLIFSSSLLVMEPTEKDAPPLDESSALQAEWDYPRSKIEAEAVLMREHGPIPTVILRLAGVYDGEGHSVPIVEQISRIYRKSLESLVFPGDKEKGQPFVHLDDAVECMRRTIARRTELDAWEVFLVAERDVMSYEELQGQIGELIHGKEWPTLPVPKPVARAGAWAQEKLPWVESFVKPWMIDLADQHYPVEIDRASRKLGWEPTRRLRDTLPHVLGRLEQDPQGWFERNGLEVPDEARTADASR